VWLASQLKTVSFFEKLVYPPAQQYDRRGRQSRRRAKAVGEAVRLMVWIHALPEFGSLLSAKFFAECFFGHSAKKLFVECHAKNPR
jgi:hypothetical protein